jgi:hypothetical protein
MKTLGWLVVAAVMGLGAWVEYGCPARTRMRSGPAATHGSVDDPGTVRSRGDIPAGAR